MTVCYYPGRRCMRLTGQAMVTPGWRTRCPISPHRPRSSRRSYSLHRVHRPVVVVGVSYGAPIAARLTMDYPELVDGLILMAPPLGPGREEYFWFTHPVEGPLIHWVVPRMLKTANREKIYHKAELTKMLPLWGRIHVPVMYLQGQEDRLVDTSNATFAREHLTNVPYLNIQMIPGRGHLIAFDEKDRIVQTIVNMIDTCQRRELQ